MGVSHTLRVCFALRLMSADRCRPQEMRQYRCERTGLFHLVEGSAHSPARQWITSSFVWSTRAVLVAGITTVHSHQVCTRSPHVSTITRQTFDLWKTGWSTLYSCQGVHRRILACCWCAVMCENTEETRVPLSFLQQVHVNGPWPGGHDVAVRANPESSDPFSVVLDGDRLLQSPSDSEILFLEEPFLRWSGNIGVFSKDKGPDAKLTLKVRSTEFNGVQSQ